MSIEGTYQVTVSTKLGEQTGTVELRVEGDVVHAKLKAPIIGTIESHGKKGEDNAFTMKGSASILFKRIDYTAEGNVKGDVLTTTLKTKDGKLTVHGTRVK